MHLYVLVYGSNREIGQEIANMEIGMSERNYGMVRRIELLELIFPKEKLTEIENMLSAPSTDIETIITSCGIRDLIEVVKVKGQPMTPLIDKRPSKGKSPSCNIIASKQDNRLPDNREIF
jgi:hypothetical protein